MLSPLLCSKEKNNPKATITHCFELPVLLPDFSCPINLIQLSHGLICTWLLFGFMYLAVLSLAVILLLQLPCLFQNLRVNAILEHIIEQIPNNLWPNINKGMRESGWLDLM